MNSAWRRDTKMFMLVSKRCAYNVRMNDATNG